MVSELGCCTTAGGGKKDFKRFLSSFSEFQYTGSLANFSDWFWLKGKLCKTFGIIMSTKPFFFYFNLGARCNGLADLSLGVPLEQDMVRQSISG